MIDLQKHRSNLSNFWQADPFPHACLENFWDSDFCQELHDELPVPNSHKWNGYYNNPIEYKKTMNIWDKFDSKLYQAFTYLTSRVFTDYLIETLEIPGLEPDVGLHGGGLHYYPPGGKLNPHIDYSHHPKLKYRRKISVLVYLNKDWQITDGGQLGLWDKDRASACEEPNKVVNPEYNTCMIFENSENSYHGLANVSQNDRYSLAMYYLVNDNTPMVNLKANFLPSADQRDDKQVRELINLRKRQRINTEINHES
tara:strand:+ start:12958 stop:13722 length:765 start_codon:yes stop_codon:yes gene_type:complete